MAEKRTACDFFRDDFQYDDLDGDDAVIAVSGSGHYRWGKGFPDRPKPFLLDFADATMMGYDEARLFHAWLGAQLEREAGR